MGLFDSPRERESISLNKGQMAGYDDILSSIKGLQSGNADVTDMDALRKKFGLTSASTSFNPARRNLQNQRGKALSSTSARLSSRIANPEAALGGVEGQFGEAAGNLEAQAAQADIGQQDYMANLLNSITGQQDQYAMQQQGLRLQGQGAKGQSISDYVNSLSGASTFDDILSLAGTASKFVNPFSLGKK